MKPWTMRDLRSMMTTRSSTCEAAMFGVPYPNPFAVLTLLIVELLSKHQSAHFSIDNYDTTIETSD